MADADEQARHNDGLVAWLILEKGFIIEMQGRFFLNVGKLGDTPRGMLVNSGMGISRPAPDDAMANDPLLKNALCLTEDAAKLLSSKKVEVRTEEQLKAPGTSAAPMASSQNLLSNIDCNDAKVIEQSEGLVEFVIRKDVSDLVKNTVRQEFLKNRGMATFPLEDAVPLAAGVLLHHYNASIGNLKDVGHVLLPTALPAALKKVLLTQQGLFFEQELPSADGALLFWDKNSADNFAQKIGLQIINPDMPHTLAEIGDIIQKKARKASKV